MYIIIHKYQRWVVNIETKQKYLKNKPEYKQKNPNYIQISFICQKQTADLKPAWFSVRMPSLDKLSTTIYTSCCCFGEGKKGRIPCFCTSTYMYDRFIHTTQIPWGGLCRHWNVLIKISQVKIRYKARYQCTVHVNMKVSGGFGVKIMVISRKGFCFEKRR